MDEFSSILQATLTPIALISGVGLLLLSMTNRYNHAINRIRSLLKDKSSRSPEEQRRIDASVRVIYGRCRIMRNAIICIGLSIVCSGAIVFVTALEGLTDLNLFLFKSVLLVIAVGLVVVAGILFVLEVTRSLNAIRLELEE